MPLSASFTQNDRFFFLLQIFVILKILLYFIVFLTKLETLSIEFGRKKDIFFYHCLYLSWTRQMLQLYLIKSITSSVMGNQLNSIISFSFSPLQHIFRQYFTKHHSFFWKKMHKKFCICNDICNVAKISLKHFMSKVELYN